MTEDPRPLDAYKSSYVCPRGFPGLHIASCAVCGAAAIPQAHGEQVRNVCVNKNCRSKIVPGIVPAKGVVPECVS